VTAETKDVLLRQLELAWRLTSRHLQTLTTDECLWRPANKGLHVRRMEDGTWLADWPGNEGYELGPPSIAWLTWHLGFWWSMALDHSFGAGTLRREDVRWAGSAEAAVRQIEGLYEGWHRAVEGVAAEELVETSRTRWPVRDRPFADLVAWANVELMKSAAEIGYARFLYAVTEAAKPPGR
jgi:hypothetical protein